ncbi:hypothetical protein V500_02984 [Pseudogymnoascus sp. VKM F-4518 (FW-2643)]|nr:hypothetical protein V500_02984 [Pseudogymnoascus sp. VKM F-4518 (FW-2643)]
MGTTSRTASVIFRVMELVSAAIVAGILGNYLHNIHKAGLRNNTRTVLSEPEIVIQLGSPLTGAGHGVGGIASLLPQLENSDILDVVAGEQLSPGVYWRDSVGNHTIEMRRRQESHMASGVATNNPHENINPTGAVTQDQESAAGLGTSVPRDQQDVSCSQCGFPSRLETSRQTQEV